MQQQAEEESPLCAGPMEVQSVSSALQSLKEEGEEEVTDWEGIFLCRALGGTGHVEFMRGGQKHHAR